MLAQAGADIEALKAVQEKDETAGETAERHVQALVIGAGGSGLAAANTLQEQGIETLVVDKMANAGGATALTGALINGGCSKQQAAVICSFRRSSAWRFLLLRASSRAVRNVHPHVRPFFTCHDLKSVGLSV